MCGYFGNDFNLLGMNSIYNPCNAVPVELATGMLQWQNNQMSYMSNMLSMGLNGNLAGQFMSVPGMWTGLNPLDCLSSVSLANLMGSGLNGANWGGFWNNVNGGSSTNSSNTSDPNTTTGKQINKLKALLDKVKEAEKDNDKIAVDYTEYKKAKTDEEKLSALKTIYNEVNSTEEGREALRKQVMKIAKISFTNEKGDKESVSYEKALELIGEPISSAVDEDVRNIKSSIDSGSNDFGAWATMTKGDILRYITAWNKVSPNKHFLMVAAEKVDKAADDVKQSWVEPISTTVNALISRAKDIDDSNIKSAADKLNSKLEEVVKQDPNSKKYNNFKKSNIEALSKEFDKLYAMTKLAEAKRINEDAKKAYGFINDFKSDDVDLIDNDFVISKIKEALKNEKIDDVDSIANNINVPSSSGTSSKSLEELANSEACRNQLEKFYSADDVAVYKTKSNYDPVRYYAEVKDSDGKYKTVKLPKDITRISGGVCTFQDGRTKSLKDLVNELDSVTIGSVEDYCKELKQLSEKVSSGKLKEVPNTNPKIFRTSKKNKNNQYNYFVMKDDKLQKITDNSVISQLEQASGTRTFDIDDIDTESGYDDDEINKPDETGTVKANAGGLGRKLSRSLGSDSLIGIFEGILTDNDDTSEKLMKDWKDYDDPDDIIEFVRGYEKQRDSFALINEKFTAKYVDSMCSAGEESAEHVKAVAGQILKVVNEKHLQLDEKDLSDLQDLAEIDGHESGYVSKWYEQNDFVMGTCGVAAGKLLAYPAIKGALSTGAAGSGASALGTVGKFASKMTTAHPILGWLAIGATAIGAVVGTCSAVKTMFSENIRKARRLDEIIDKVLELTQTQPKVQSN